MHSHASFLSTEVGCFENMSDWMFWIRWVVTHLALAFHQELHIHMCLYFCAFNKFKWHADSQVFICTVTRLLKLNAHAIV